MRANILFCSYFFMGVAVQLQAQVTVTGKVIFSIFSWFFLGTFLFLVCFLISVLIRTFAYEK